MARRSNYDPALRKTEQGKKLYGTWRRTQRYSRCKEWDDFPAFYDWAVHNGYVNGAWLKRIDEEVPYRPDNCVWYYPNDYVGDRMPVSWADEWNKTVNRIRKHYGMPPLEGTEYGD